MMWNRSDISARNGTLLRQYVMEINGKLIFLTKKYIFVTIYRQKK
jgi:hypothetical protein